MRTIIAVLALCILISAVAVTQYMPPGVGSCQGQDEDDSCQTDSGTDGTCQTVGGGDLMQVLSCVPKNDIKIKRNPTTPGLGTCAGLRAGDPCRIDGNTFGVCQVAIGGAENMPVLVCALRQSDDAQA